MYPVLFQLGPLVIHSYGVMIALAVLLGVFVGLREGRRLGLEEGVLLDLAFYGTLAGVIGARLWHAATDWPHYVGRPWEILFFWQPGLAIQGVVVAAIATTVWLARRRRISFWQLADAGAPGLVLGQAIGRIGCFLAGCCYGVECDLPWAVPLAGAHRHPTQIYEFSVDLAIFAVLWTIRRRKPFEGFVFLVYAVMWSSMRVLLDFLRADTPIVAYGMRWAQLAGLTGVAIGLLIIGVRLWLEHGQGAFQRSSS